MTITRIKKMKRPLAIRGTAFQPEASQQAEKRAVHPVALG
jgi:hypothetical protein